MKIITLDDILVAVKDKAAVVDAVKMAFIAHSRNQIVMPPPVQMLFNDNGDGLNGDCHIKTAYSSTHPYYCVKVASGFYKNPELGLPVNNGLVMLFSSETGQPLALFQDDGYMTSVRTAAAGALSVSVRPCSEPIKLAIAGTGHQAELQARWICFYNVVSKITVWGRTGSKAQALAQRLADLSIEISTVETTTQLCQNSNVIVTATPSTQPIIMSEDIEPGHHIVALGSDSPGKVELDPKILARADQIILDDHEQCLHHGEFGHAVRSKLITDSGTLLLGQCLESGANSALSNPDAITVVDLTGLGAQDLALATMVWEGER